jgi:hypothetical protein
LQNAIHDLQLPITTPGETRVVRHHQQRFVPFARQVQ